MTISRNTFIFSLHASFQEVEWTAKLTGNLSQRWCCSKGIGARGHVEHTLFMCPWAHLVYVSPALGPFQGLPRGRPIMSRQSEAQGALSGTGRNNATYRHEKAFNPPEFIFLRSRPSWGGLAYTNPDDGYHDNQSWWGSSSHLNSNVSIASVYKKKLGASVTLIEFGKNPYFPLHFVKQIHLLRHFIIYYVILLKFDYNLLMNPT